MADVVLFHHVQGLTDGMRAFGAGGFTQVEILLWPRTLAALEAMAPVLELLDAD